MPENINQIITSIGQMSGSIAEMTEIMRNTRKPSKKFPFTESLK
jgi:hypothetical protein